MCSCESTCGLIRRHGRTIQKAVIMGTGRSPFVSSSSSQQGPGCGGTQWVLAFGHGIGRTLPLCEINRKWNQPSRHQCLVRQHHPFPGRRGSGFPSYPAKAKPSKWLPWHPVGDNGTAVLSGRHSVAAVPGANTHIQLRMSTLFLWAQGPWR